MRAGDVGMLVMLGRIVFREIWHGLMRLEGPATPSKLIKSAYICNYMNIPNLLFDVALTPSNMIYTI